MVKIAILRMTFGLSLLLLGVGCTPLGFLQPAAPKATWAEDYEENNSRNANEIGKFSGNVTDDKNGKSGPSPKQAGNAEAAQGQKQIPLDRKRMIVMPLPPNAKQLSDGSEESEMPDEMNGRHHENDRDATKNAAPPPVIGPEIGNLPNAFEGPDPAQGTGKQYPPFIRKGPTVKGEILDLGPNDRPVEKAVEFARRLAASEAENRFLAGRLQKLEADLEARDKSLAEATGEIELATSEIVKSRRDLQGLRKEVTSLRERLRQAEKDEIETMRSVISALERMLQTPPTKSKE